jgi:hypothetical protein
LVLCNRAQDKAANSSDVIEPAVAAGITTHSDDMQLASAGNHRQLDWVVQAATPGRLCLLCDHLTWNVN